MSSIVEQFEQEIAKHEAETDKLRNEKGDVFYFNEEGQHHRTDGPAVEYADGDKEWWLNDRLHREDGPAVEYADGSKFWYRNGLLHREDGPAIEWVSGSKEWWVKNKRHRTDGPAVEREREQVLVSQRGRVYRGRVQRLRSRISKVMRFSKR